MVLSGDSNKKRPRSSIQVRIDELNVELEAAQREARAALAELQKFKHLYEKAVEQKEALARENKKLHGSVKLTAVSVEIDWIIVFALT